MSGQGKREQVWEALLCSWFIRHDLICRREGTGSCRAACLVITKMVPSSAIVQEFSRVKAESGKMPLINTE